MSLVTGVRRFCSRFWAWMRPLGPWLEREVWPVAISATKYIVQVNLSHPEWSGSQKREWVVEQLQVEYTAKGLSLSMTVILTAIQLAYQKYVTESRRG